MVHYLGKKVRVFHITVEAIYVLPISRSSVAHIQNYKSSIGMHRLPMTANCYQ